jgi:ribosomal protein S18 acetylase RimI-like enzyme
LTAPEEILSGVTFRRAELRDLPGVLHSLTTAAQWTQDRGQQGWPVPFPEQYVRPSIERNELYVAEWQGEIGGSFALRWTDDDFWGPQPPIAGYLHQLAVRRDRPLRGLGRRLVAWAIDLVRQNGRPLIRLDCVSSNRSIIAYYEQLGFQPVRVVPYPHDKAFDVLLMERPAVASEPS